MAERDESLTPTAVGEIGAHSPRVFVCFDVELILGLTHYFDFIKRQVDLQHEYPGEVFFQIYNCQDRATERHCSDIDDPGFDLACACLASGLDPNKATLYRQSDVPQIREMSRIFRQDLLELIPNDNLSDGDCELGTRYSTRSRIENAIGLLALRSTLVAGDIEQLGMTSFARHMAIQFKNLYSGEIFPIPRHRLITHRSLDIALLSRLLEGE